MVRRIERDGDLDWDRVRQADIVNNWGEERVRQLEMDWDTEVESEPGRDCEVESEPGKWIVR